MSFSEVQITFLDEAALKVLDQVFLASLIEIDKDFFPVPWTQELWREMNEGYFLSLVFERGELCGFALFRLIPIDSLGHLLKIVLKKGHTGKGYAAKLLSETLNTLKQSYGISRCYLEVAEGNTSAIKLYERCGLKKLHLLRNFYGASKHAFSMSNY